MFFYKCIAVAGQGIIAITHFGIILKKKNLETVDRKFQCYVIEVK